MPRMASRADPWGRPWPRLAAGVVGVIAAAGSTLALLVTVLAATADPPVSLVERALPAWMLALGLLAGLAVTGATWIVSIDRSAVAVALAVTSAGALVPVWAGIFVLPPAAQAGALAAAPLAVAGVSHVGLRWSRGAGPASPVRVIYALAIAAVVVLLAGYDPLSDPGCNLTCAEVQPSAAALISSHAAYAFAAALIAAAGIIAMLELVREAARGRSDGVAWAALLGVVVLVTSWIAHAVRWTDSVTTEAMLLPAVIAGLLAGIAPIAATASIRRRRLRVQEMVEKLSDTYVVGGAADGHHLRVHYAVPDDVRWVDASGHEVAPGAEPARAVVVSDAGGPALRLEVPADKDPEELLATLTPATMLALQNARLAAVGRARLADVRASQRRIVDASDAERQRIERDLHDGAQQRLVGASFQLSVARGRLVAGGETLSRAEAFVREALERLRLLGHGIFPATLATDGLAAALEDLARTSDVPVTLEIPELGLARDVALAAYALVATVLAHAVRPSGAVSAEVGATTQDGGMELRVRLMGSVRLAEDDLVDVADRVGAVGGRLAVESIDDGVAVTAVLPCA
jgi:signal transduction histidine kinase